MMSDSTKTVHTEVSRTGLRASSERGPISSSPTPVTSAAADRKRPVPAAQRQQLVAQYVQALDIRPADPQALMRNLSGGNQQKVLLARWLITQPDLLILDEPTRGIDVGAKYEIYTIINRMVAAGKAVVVISSELPELLGICDRIYTLAFGRITGVLPVAEATQESLMELMTMEKDKAR